MGHNFRKLTTNIIEKAKDELGYGMNIGLRLSIFEKKMRNDCNALIDVKMN